MAEAPPSQVDPPVEEAEHDDDVLLPSADDRSWLIARMAELVERRGYEHLVLAPLLQADDRHFPDRWGGGDSSVRRLIARLLIYADLDHARVQVVIHDDADVGGPVAPAGLGAPLWFVRLQAGVLHFAGRQSALRDPRLLVPAAARAVAEAWRAWHRLTVNDVMTEQRLVDVTTVYLGFGLLTTDAAVRHGAERAGGFRLTRTKSQLGVLGPQAMAFVLGVQAVARGLDRSGRRRIAKPLQPNQAGFFRAALALLDARTPSVAHALALPPPAQWPDPPDLESLTAPLPDDEGDAPEQAQEIRRDHDKGVSGMNAGRPVFRVERTKALRLAKMLGLPAVLLGILVNRMNMGIDVPMWQVGAVAAGLALLGLVIGRFLEDVRCSEPKCGEPLTRELEVCPRCGGTVRGVIHHPKERLAAEDALPPATGQR